MRVVADRLGEMRSARGVARPPRANARRTHCSDLRRARSRANEKLGVERRCDGDTTTNKEEKSLPSNARSQRVATVRRTTNGRSGKSHSHHVLRLPIVTILIARQHRHSRWRAVCGDAGWAGIRRQAAAQGCGRAHANRAAQAYGSVWRSTRSTWNVRRCRRHRQQSEIRAMRRLERFAAALASAASRTGTHCARGESGDGSEPVTLAPFASSGCRRRPVYLRREPPGR